MGSITQKPPFAVERIDRSNVLGIIEAVAKNGCCIVKNFTDEATVAQVNRETRPYLDADVPWKVSPIPQFNAASQWFDLYANSPHQRVIYSHPKHVAAPI